MAASRPENSRGTAEETPGQVEHDPLASVHVELGEVARWGGDPNAARKHYTQAVAILQETPDAMRTQAGVGAVGLCVLSIRTLGRSRRRWRS